MKRAKGATLAEIMEATADRRTPSAASVASWAARAGRRSNPLKNDAGERTYRIAK